MAEINLRLGADALKRLFGDDSVLEVGVTHAAIKEVMKAHVSAVVPSYLEEVDARLKAVVSAALDERLAMNAHTEFGVIKYDLSPRAREAVKSTCDRVFTPLLKEAADACLERLKPSIDVWMSQRMDVRLRDYIDQQVRDRLAAISEAVSSEKKEEAS